MSAYGRSTFSSVPTAAGNAASSPSSSIHPWSGRSWITSASRPRPHTSRQQDRPRSRSSTSPDHHPPARRDPHDRAGAHGLPIPSSGFISPGRTPERLCRQTPTRRISDGAPDRATRAERQKPSLRLLSGPAARSVPHLRLVGEHGTPRRTSCPGRGARTASRPGNATSAPRTVTRRGASVGKRRASPRGRSCTRVTGR